MTVVKTVVLGPRPGVLQDFLDRRRALGQDLFDEVWEGVYHVAPAPHFRHGYVDNLLAVLLGPSAKAAGLVGTGPFNLGDEDDFRVPDGGYHRNPVPAVWMATAAVVVEVVSPDDETWAKFDFYARHDVDEICVADPFARELRWFALAGPSYEEVGHSALLDVAVADLAGQIEWPA
jgi:Uma2 family endonuclease